MSKDDETNEQELTPAELLEEAEALTANLQTEIGDWEPPTDKRWNDLGHNPALPMLRIAWITVMHKTSAEITAMLDGLGDDPDVLAAMMRQLNWTGGYLEKLQHLCQIAELRLLAHGAPEAVQDWLQDAPLPPEPKQNWRARPSLNVVR